MEVEHLIGLGVVLVVAVLSAWLVWSCLCKNKDDMDGDDVESQQSEEEVKSVNSRTKVISRQMTAYENDHNSSTKETQHQHNLQQSEQFLKPSYKPGGGKKKASCYVQSSSIGLADPFGEWTRREKDVDDTEALSGLKTYRKSPVLPHRR